MKEALGDSQAVVIVAADKDSHPHLSLSSLLQDSGDMVASCDSPTSEDLCVLPYSSGTTGVPKGVMLTHANLVANMAQLNHPALDLMNDGETTICVLPLFHIFAMNVTMSNMLLNGGKLVTLPSFEPGEQFNINICTAANFSDAPKLAHITKRDTYVLGKLPIYYRYNVTFFGVIFESFKQNDQQIFDLGEQMVTDTNLIFILLASLNIFRTVPGCHVGTPAHIPACSPTIGKLVYLLTYNVLYTV